MRHWWLDSLTNLCYNFIRSVLLIHPAIALFSMETILSDSLVSTLQKEGKILRSGVRNVFTPHMPVRSMELFLGRQREVQKIVEHINTPGQHVLLYGDRGVGKSSLANVTTDLIISKMLKGKLFTKRCDSSDTFESIVHEPLRSVGYDPDLAENTSSLKEGGKAGLNIHIAEAGIQTERENKATYRRGVLSPSIVAANLWTNHLNMVLPRSTGL